MEPEPNKEEDKKPETAEEQEIKQLKLENLLRFNR
jgi:hypothetical protein